MPKPPNGSIAVADDFPCLLNERLQRFRNFVFGFADLDAFEQDTVSPGSSLVNGPSVSTSTVIAFMNSSVELPKSG